ATARAALARPPIVSAPATISTALPPLVPLALPAIQPAVPFEAPPPQAAETKTEQVPTPPLRVAAANEPAAERPPAKIEFGIDLGGGASLEALRVHWASVKANYGPLPTGLHPLAAHRPKPTGGRTYRLVAGPLPNAAEAARLCARFPVARLSCRPAKFDGVQLAEH
ncbi:MAG: SPOR domain-containing protein, partial [Pseudolabrys sp.]